MLPKTQYLTPNVGRISPRDLGDGLVLRSSTAQDAEAVGRMAAEIFRTSPDAPLNARQLPRTLELASGNHPLSGPDHGIVVEDTRRGVLAASMWLLPVTWEYEGIPFGVGRPEQVVCRPEYRGRSIMQRMFEAFHARSAAHGEHAQTITGISYYYRQFGYAYALQRDRGHKIRFDAIAPVDPAAQYRLRDATPDDVPTIKALYDQSVADSPIRAQVPAEYWRWTLWDADQSTNETHSAAMLVDAEGIVRGCAVYADRRYDNTLPVMQVMVEPEHLRAAADAIVCGLRDRAAGVPVRAEADDIAADALSFRLGAGHPFYNALAPDAFTHIERRYAWYVRVPDMAAFLGHVQEVLDRRVAQSWVDYTGELLLDAYEYGVRFAFERGTMSTVEPWRRARRPVPGPEPDAALPPWAMTELVFGYRSIDALLDIYPDVNARPFAIELLRALFPARPSFIMEMN